MKALPKNYSLKSKNLHIKKQCRHFIVLALFLFSLFGKSQIANYVNNGGFEEVVTPPGYLPKFWGATDTTKLFGELLSKTIAPIRVPWSSFGYQWPRHGNNQWIGLQYCPTCNGNFRTYPRNRLKQVLVNGKTYCVKFYVNLSNQSTHGIDAIGAFFSNSDLDTIKNCNAPITYLMPQIQNLTNNIITDTLNWVVITGTFVANGTEKYMVIGNFKSNLNTNKVLVNPANLPANAADYLIDDVSCIDVDLPAHAGSDVSFIPGDSVFIGRQPDIGIDEACQWYKLPTIITPTTPAMDTTAGLWVKPTITTTYVVRQEICGNIKWDTVVVYKNAVGLEKLKLITEELKIYPIPAKDYIELSVSNADMVKSFNTFSIYNSVGVLMQEEEHYFEDTVLRLNTENLPDGFYTLQLKNPTNETVHKRFVISK